MGVSYTAIPLSARFYEEESVTWLADDGVTLPPGLSDGRYPTLNEIRQVLDNLNDYKHDLSFGTSSCELLVTEIAESANRRWASIRIFNYFGQPGEENIPHDFYFERGYPDLVIQIVQALAIFCGPFLLLVDGEHPQLIVADSNSDIMNGQLGKDDSC